MVLAYNWLDMSFNNIHNTFEWMRERKKTWFFDDVTAHNKYYFFSITDGTHITYSTFPSIGYSFTFSFILFAFQIRKTRCEYFYLVVELNDDDDGMEFHSVFFFQFIQNEFIWCYSKKKLQEFWQKYIKHLSKEFLFSPLNKHNENVCVYWWWWWWFWWWWCQVQKRNKLHTYKMW